MEPQLIRGQLLLRFPALRGPLRGAELNSHEASFLGTACSGGSGTRGLFASSSDEVESNASQLVGMEQAEVQAQFNGSGTQLFKGKPK